MHFRDPILLAATSGGCYTLIIFQKINSIFVLMPWQSCVVINLHKCFNFKAETVIRWYSLQTSSITASRVDLLQFFYFLFIYFDFLIFLYFKQYFLIFLNTVINNWRYSLYGRKRPTTMLFSAQRQSKCMYLSMYLSLWSIFLSFYPSRYMYVYDYPSIYLSIYL